MKIGKNTRLYVFIALVLILFVLNQFFGWAGLLSDPGSLLILQDALEQNIALAIFLYILLTMIGCVVLALPGLVFAVCAGMMFGPVSGTIACSIATSLGALLAFLAGRYFLKDSIKPLVMKSPRLKKLLFESSNKNAIFLLMITRLIPIFPYNLQNYAYGITNINIIPYTLYSFLFMLPGTAVYTVAASGFLDKENRVSYLLFAGALFAILVAGSLVVYRQGNFIDEK